MKDQILAINQVLNEYFKQSPYKVAAKDLMYLFVKNGIFLRFFNKNIIFFIQILYVKKFNCFYEFIFLI